MNQDPKLAEQLRYDAWLAQHELHRECVLNALREQNRMLKALRALEQQKAKAATA